MHITVICPKCTFERHIPTSKVPESASMATCPKCEHKFRIRDAETGDFLPNIVLGEDVPSFASPEKPVQDPPLQAYTMEDSLSQNADKVQKENTDDEDRNDDDKNKESENLKKSIDDMISVAYQDSDKMPMGTDDVPWEHPERYGIFGSFFHTVKRTMLNPREFFTHMHNPTSLLRPASFYILIGLFQAFMLRLFSIQKLKEIQETALSPETQQLAQQAVEIWNIPFFLVSAIAAVVLQLLIFTAFIYLMVRLVHPDRSEFHTTFRIVAYSASPFLLSIIPFGNMVGMIWFIVNLFIGVKYALHLTWEKTFLSLIPLLLFWLVLNVAATNILLSAASSVL